MIVSGYNQVLYPFRFDPCKGQSGASFFLFCRLLSNCSICWRDYHFPGLLTVCCGRLVGCAYVGSPLVFLACFINMLLYFCKSTRLFYYHYTIIHLKTWNCDFSGFSSRILEEFLFLKIALVIFSPIYIIYASFFLIQKNSLRIFIGIGLNLYITFNNMNILIMLTLHPGT